MAWTKPVSSAVLLLSLPGREAFQWGNLHYLGALRIDQKKGFTVGEGTHVGDSEVLGGASTITVEIKQQRNRDGSVVGSGNVEQVLTRQSIMFQSEADYAVGYADTFSQESSLEDSSDLSDEYQSLHQSSYADLSEESLLESEDWLSLSTESEDSVFSSDAWLPSVL